MKALAIALRYSFASCTSRWFENLRRLRKLLITSVSEQLPVSALTRLPE